MPGADPTRPSRVPSACLQQRGIARVAGAGFFLARPAQALWLSRINYAEPLLER
jgi:hypothetical protein